MIIIIHNEIYFSDYLKPKNKLVSETWKQKLVTMVVAVTVGGGVTTMARMVPHTTVCRKSTCMD